MYSFCKYTTFIPYYHHSDGLFSADNAVFPSFCSKWVFNISALCGPSTSVSSSRLASFIFLTLLNLLRSASFALGPMPLMSSSSECKACLLRLSLWKVIAYLCTSSCICVRTLKSSLSGGRATVCGGNPYRSSLVRCRSSLARPAIGMSRCNSLTITS